MQKYCTSMHAMMRIVSPQAVQVLTSRPNTRLRRRFQCIERAIAVARQRDAKLYELRSALRLARLRRGQSKGKEAKELLEELGAR